MYIFYGKVSGGQHSIQEDIVKSPDGVADFFSFELREILYTAFFEDDQASEWGCYEGCDSHEGHIFSSEEGKLWLIRDCNIGFPGCDEFWGAIRVGRRNDGDGKSLFLEQP